MHIDGNTLILGIIGNPVRHTMSPAIHNFISKKLGKNMVYVPFEVTGDVRTAVKGAFELGIKGMNVTVPYKSDVIDVICDIDDMADRIGAVNTLVRKENGYKGYNTDILGLEREMKDEDINLNGENVVLIGAGGAARAAAFLAAKHNANNLVILNRTLEKAEAIAEDVRKYVSDTGKNTVVKTYALSDYDKIEENSFVAVQCTKIGLKEEDGAAIEDTEFYSKVTAGVDLIYRENTKFQMMVREAGGRVYTGLKMLVYQGIAAYELWNDITVDDETIEGVMEIVNGR